ncbi:MAG: hypothetical protein LBJ35_05265 [Spirochaetaceae bacterium]|nr:hypothetical protein [Spirochaetaceae bacterium]
MPADLLAPAGLAEERLGWFEADLMEQAEPLKQAGLTAPAAGLLAGRLDWFEADLTEQAEPLMPADLLAPADLAEERIGWFEADPAE